MARPKGKDYTESIYFRLTETDKTRIEIDADKSGLSVSEYIRHCCLDAGTLSLPSNQNNNAMLISAINRVGVNLNQLTRVANSTKVIDPVALTEALERLTSLLDSLLSGEGGDDSTYS